MKLTFNSPSLSVRPNQRPKKGKLKKNRRIKLRKKNKKKYKIRENSPSETCATAYNRMKGEFAACNHIENLKEKN